MIFFYPRLPKKKRERTLFNYIINVSWWWLIKNVLCFSYVISIDFLFLIGKSHVLLKNLKTTVFNAFFKAIEMKKVFQAVGPSVRRKLSLKLVLTHMCTKFQIFFLISIEAREPFHRTLCRDFQGVRIPDSSTFRKSVRLKIQIWIKLGLVGWA